MHYQPRQLSSSVKKDELDSEMDEMARRQFENISLSDVQAAAAATSNAAAAAVANSRNRRRFDGGPLMKLSVQLIHTYRKINDQYYKSRQK